MILDDTHVELLAWCKPKIERANGHSYICIWLEYAILEKFQIEDFEESLAALTLYNQITSVIHDALGDKPTVFAYLSSRVDGFCDLSSKQKVEFCALARMAWIDKMIETRTIA